MSDDLHKKIIGELEKLVTRGSVTERELDGVLDENFKALLKEAMKK